MEFLFVASFPGSIVSFRGDLIKVLQESGLSVTVAAPGLHLGSLSRRAVESIGAKAIDIPLTRTGTNPLKDLILLWQLTRLIKRLRPAIVFGYTVKPVIYGSIAAWLARVPNRFAMITGLGYAFTGQRSDPVALITRGLYRLALRRVHKVFFQNPDDLNLFQSNRIVSSKQSTVVVNGSGVNIDYYPFSTSPSAPVRFLLIGRLLGDKGVREYVEAAAQIARTHTDVHFAIVGWIDGNPDAISQLELDQWADSGVVEYLGKLDDVRPALAECSVYVLPSYREGTPRTVLEAMATGRAVITTDAPGCRETVIHGENGFLVKPGSVDELVSAMRRFIDDPNIIDTMGRRSREIAEDRYDVRKVNEVIIREMGIKT